ncbi:pyridoxal-phosphate dependent enzyme [Mycobacterium yunnanensis]|uniref:Pyridoxal-phosphate dependent enzyme n=1 Tax=Mycobacterium yunnanensis TaxID=368477 RepID=A0A9X2Z0P9_9MYCO|nr:pyridoxal-phosphate dependent enzyme [Mycobacterium yunnanensis]MCV7420900.1 pyridoxal-phosphate dependent enzyme [Mycobacterium yunnanensis]
MSIGERVPLGTFPTPLEAAPRLAAALGLGPEDLWIKRDDLIGLGGGGNKVRKLQYTVAAAMAGGATTLVTTGAAQSNHARLTAAAGARLGLDVVLVLAGSGGAVAGNLALNALLGARIVWAGDVEAAETEQLASRIVEELTADGRPAAQIPFGGSNAVGAHGYVDAGHELLEQLPGLAQVVVAVGSGGTAAGLVHALGERRVLGVHTGAVPDPEARISGMLASLGSAHADGELRLRTDQVGAGYSSLTHSVQDALALAARTEGLILDPVYTGRALAGLAAAVLEGDVRPGEPTVFLHSGGLPGLFGSSAAMVWAGSLGDAAEN